MKAILQPLLLSCRARCI